MSVSFKLLCVQSLRSGRAKTKGKECPVGFSRVTVVGETDCVMCPKNVCIGYYSYLDSSISETPIRKGRLYFGWHLCWHADGLLTLLRTNHSQHYVKVTWAMPQSVAHLEKFSLNFSISLFVIRVNLLHP